MRTRRRLAVGPDGTAEVHLLTDPVPRHVSIVSWGANDAPAVSWKSAIGVVPGAAAHALRSPPPAAAMASAAGLREFVEETVDAWQACLSEALAEPLSAAERSSRVRAVTVQAGARVAAACTSIGDRLAGTHRSCGLALPKQPSGSTLQGELDRRSFQAGLEQAGAALIDASLTAASEATNSTERVLAAFGDAADLFSAWAGSLPGGQVGVSQMAGRRNSKQDRDRLLAIRQTIDELLSDERTEPDESKESHMTLAEQLKALAKEDPMGLLEAIDTAIRGMPKGTAKFAWGDTGVGQYDPEKILAGLLGLQAGTALQAAIAQAVGGIDVNSTIGDGVRVASTMRAALSGMVAKELSANPDGSLATSIKTAVAAATGEAIAQSLKALIDGGVVPSPAGGDLVGGFEAPAGADPWRADLPKFIRD